MTAKTNKERRVVILAGEALPAQGRPRIWGYGYRDLAKLFGMSVGSVRVAVAQGRLNPANLDSICDFWVKHRERRAAEEAAAAATAATELGALPDPHLPAAD